MQVILLQDVAKIGRRHAIVEVPDGFARNKLIPMKAAIPATKENVAKYKQLQAHAAGVRESEAATLANSLKALAGTSVTVAAQANEKGHLFKAITKEMIAVATTASNAPIPAEALNIKQPIKAVGDHEVAVVAGNVKGSITVSVVAA